MDVRNNGAIFFRTSIILLFSWATFISLFFSYFYGARFLFYYYNYFYIYLHSSLFSINLEFFSIVFVFIVSFVTFLVTNYSEYYMEHYNIKKFFFLLLSFFFAIVILSLRSTPLSLIIGWDGLGITSICLIMFYPNKVGLFNSLLTIFFNRLGDVLIILSISFIFISDSHFFYFFLRNNFILFILLGVCRFTKRAQFPLSSWLPAAMSAPTPISAMVHSSTLVTAGIFLIYKIIFYFFFTGLDNPLSLVCCVRFLLGGIISRFEFDFKKMIAFSTIRQIRIIFFFGRIFLFFYRRAHMFFHALFKTLLFCCAGSKFFSLFIDQGSFFVSLLKTTRFSRIFFFFRIFRITGLFFSSSYFSKDSVLEFFLNSFFFFFFFVLLLGGCFTLLYSRKLFFSCISFSSLNNSFFSKRFLMLPLFIFLIICVFCGDFYYFSFSLINSSFVSLFDLIFTIVILVSSIMLLLPLSLLSFYFTLHLFIIKDFSYSVYASFLGVKNISIVFFRDLLFFKSLVNLPFTCSFFFLNILSSYALYSFFSFFIFFFYYYLE